MCMTMMALMLMLCMIFSSALKVREMLLQRQSRFSFTGTLLHSTVHALGETCIFSLSSIQKRKLLRPLIPHTISDIPRFCTPPPKCFGVCFRASNTIPLQHHNSIVLHAPNGVPQYRIRMLHSRDISNGNPPDTNNVPKAFISQMPWRAAQKIVSRRIPNTSPKNIFFLPCHWGS